VAIAHGLRRAGGLDFNSAAKAASDMAHGFSPWVIKFSGYQILGVIKFLDYPNYAVIRRSVGGVPLTNHTGSNLRRACGKAADRAKAGKPEIAVLESLYLRFL
jgi:hypothetical protein